MKHLLLLLSLLCLPSAFGAETSSPFDESILAFKGSAVEQAQCLLRPVHRFGNLGEPLATLPGPLERLIGLPVGVGITNLLRYLEAHSISHEDFGGPLTNHLAAKYFVIHDTSTPNYGEQPIPTNINTPEWSHNNLSRWQKSPVGHLFVNRLGQSFTAHTWVTPWRATKLEARVLGEKSRGLFVHTEMIQPRQRDPKAGPKNDAIAPEPGFTEVQLDRLALLYLTASFQHGTWMIPGFHACVDAGIPDAHDDPQNFELARWANRLAALLKDLGPETDPTKFSDKGK